MSESKTVVRTGEVEFSNGTIFSIAPGALNGAVKNAAKEKYPGYKKLINGEMVGDTVSPLRMTFRFEADLKLSYSREELIALCERAIVPQKLWVMRGSEDAQKDIGRSWQLLRCGCDFEIQEQTDEQGIRVQFFVHNEEWFEHGDNPDNISDHTGFNLDSEGNCLFFYIPTERTLEKAQGKDWEGIESK